MIFFKGQWKPISLPAPPQQAQAAREECVCARGQQPAPEPHCCGPLRRRSSVDVFNYVAERGVQTFFGRTELAACKTLGSSAISSAKREKSAITLQFNTVETFLVANYDHRCSPSQIRARKDA